MTCYAVEWNEVRSLLNLQFRLLLTMSMSEAVGTAIGSSARKLEAVGTLEVGLSYNVKVPISYILPFRGKSFGTEVFPELSPLTTAMNEGVRVSFQEANTNFEASSSMIRQACARLICKRRGKEAARYCCVVHLQTIISLLRSLSSISLPADVRLMSIGLDRFSNSQMEQHLVSRTRKGPPPYSLLGYGSDIRSSSAQTSRCSTPLY